MCYCQDQCLKAIKCPILSSHVHELLLCNITVISVVLQTFSVRPDRDMAQSGPGANTPHSAIPVHKQGGPVQHTFVTGTISKCWFMFLVHVLIDLHNLIAFQAALLTDDAASQTRKVNDKLCRKALPLIGSLLYFD